jgi:hypothetical protein
MASFLIAHILPLSVAPLLTAVASIPDPLSIKRLPSNETAGDINSFNAI